MCRPPSPGSVMSVLAMLLLAAGAVADPPPPLVLDPPPTLAIGDARIVEGLGGTSTLAFPVRLSGPPGSRATVAFTTVDGTATAQDGDFGAVSGQLVFSPVDSLLTIEVPVFGDPHIEPNEWFLVRLSEPVGFAFADSEAFGVITNDERATFARMWVGEADYLEGSLPTAWGDFNGDGDPDIPLFFAGPGPTFSEIPGFRALLAGGTYHGASSCDYDRDGDVDLVLLGYKLDEPGTPNLLLRNDGAGTFTNVAPALGMDIAGNAETAVWGDFDADGWPDLFAPYYSHVYPYQSSFYHNNRDGTFSDRAQASGVAMAEQPGELRPEGAHAADWNDDGHLDLYCASHLFLNDGTGNFFDVRESVGLPAMFDEGAMFVDYDNDGDLDLYLRGAYPPHHLPHLFRNDGGRFTDVAKEAGITDIALFWGDSWADVDNDGDLDLVQHGSSTTTRLMLNQGDGTFVEDPAFRPLTTGRELSTWGDADGDGDLDVIIGPTGKQILVNQLQFKPRFHNSRLRVRVLDADGHETAHGATVRLRRLGGGPVDVQTRVVDGGSGYLGQGEYTVHFGGIGSGRFALEVVYPSPAGSRVVVDSLSDARLGSIESGQYSNGLITIYRDRRVDFPEQAVAGVTRPSGFPGAVHRLGPPSPAPARSSVAIPVALGRTTRASLDIHDLRGRAVRTLDLGVAGAGGRTIEWDLRDQCGEAVATGVYFCRLRADGAPGVARRILVIR